MQQEDIHFIHLSDLHVLPAEACGLWELDGARNLRAVLDAVREMDVTPAFFLITGDLADNGEPASYQRLLVILDEMESLGTPVLLGLGNHDHRVPFRQVVLRESDADEEQRYFYSRMIGDLRVIVLDSKVSGAVHGDLSPEQLEWLKEELSEPAPEGTVLALHHPPFRNGIPFLDDHTLRNADALRQLLVGSDSDVLGILTGHTHVAGFSTFANVACVTAPGTAFLLDPSTQKGIRMLGGTGFNLVSLRQGTLTVSPVLLPGGRPEIYHLRPEEMVAMLGYTR